MHAKQLKKKKKKAEKAKTPFMHYALLAHEKLPPPRALSLWIARPDTQRPQAQIVVPMPIRPKLTSVRRILFGEENHLFQFRWSQKIPEKPTEMC